ncbi:S41 family peptidase [Rufibacter glacialis]|uniref:S41 family peptidase n=1 Tax=Rufibacter glacialis TaxID=1259555 RepID=UPI00166D1C89|nr:S41 family peptidase [Rufibacter glacialis]
MVALLAWGHAFGQNTLDTDKHLNFYHIWGLLKYQHPALATGKVSADSLFLRYLPLVDSAQTQKQANSVYQALLKEVGPSPLAKVDKVRDHPKGTLLVQNLNDHWYTRSKFLNSNNRKQLENIFQRRYTAEPHQYVTIRNNPYGGTLPNEPKYVFPEKENLPYPMRMLALAKMKAAIDYLFPYKYLMDESWETAIAQAIPLFAQCPSRQEYERLLLTLNAKLNDTQGYSFFRQLHHKDKIFKNSYYPPFDYQVVEEKILVTGIIDPALCRRSNIKVGDVLGSLDDIALTEWVKALGAVLSVSNQQALWHRVGEYGDNFLFRSEDAVMKVHLQRGQDTLQTTLRLMDPTDPAKAKLIDGYFKKKQAPGKKRVGLEMVSKDIYRFKAHDTNRYIENASEEREAVIMDSLFRIAVKGKGIIFDMRGEPDNSDFVFLDVFRKFGRGNSYFARYYLMNAGTVGTYKLLTQPEVYYPTTVTPEGYAYDGKVVILVNGATQGVGEWLTMNLQHMFPNSITLGEQTAGADGDLKRLNLPGNYVMEFSGNAIFYPNQRPTQRTGVKVDLTVKPTLKNTLAKKDDQLLKALEIIREEAPKPEAKK